MKGVLLTLIVIVLQIVNSRATAAIYRWDNGELITNDLAEPYADFSNVDLSYADLDDATMHHANFSGGMLTFAHLRRAGLMSTNLYQTNASYAYFMDANLTGSILNGATLNGANFSGANLTNAQLMQTSLTGANFSGAIIDGANFGDVTATGFTSFQLYSTASYQQGNLQNIILTSSNIPGWSFADQDLTNSDLAWVNLTGSDLTHSNMTNISLDEATLSKANISYANLNWANLTEANLFNAKLTGTNLTDANLDWAKLTNTVMNNAIIRGASFYRATENGFHAGQLYSTASHAMGDLREIKLRYNDLSGWDFSGQALGNARFDRCTLVGTDFTAADLRGAVFNTLPALVDDAVLPDGRLENLVLGAGQTRTFWDYDGLSAMPILIEEQLTLDAGASVTMLFEDTDWGSTITFGPGATATLGGTLVLDFASDVQPWELVGSSFELFDWTGIAPVGQFATIATPADTMWDTSDLYTTGQVVLTAFIIESDSDFNGNGIVDAADLAIWQNGFGAIESADLSDGDGDGDGDVDGSDFMAWQRDFGTAGNGTLTASAIPEPASCLLILTAIAGAFFFRRHF